MQKDCKAQASCLVSPQLTMSRHFTIKKRQLVTVINITKCPIDHSKFIWLVLSKCFPLRSGNKTVCWMFRCLGHVVLLGVGEVFGWDGWSWNFLIEDGICLQWQCADFFIFLAWFPTRTGFMGFFCSVSPSPPFSVCWLPPSDNFKKIWLLLI